MSFFQTIRTKIGFHFTLDENDAADYQKYSLTDRKLWEKMKLIRLTCLIISELILTNILNTFHGR